MNWKKLATWAGSIIATAVILAVVAVVVLAHNEAFRRYILAKAEQSIGNSLGARVQIQDFSLHISPIRIDLSNATVYGNGPQPGGPLFHVDHMGVGIRIVSLLHRKWQFSDVELNHPTAHVFVDQSGNSNLLTPKSSSNSQTNIFDLAVLHATINQGEIYYNDRKSVVNADVYDLQFASLYDASQGGRYFGDLGYRGGQLQFGSYAPVPHSIQIHFDATRSGMTLAPVVLHSGASELKMNASVENYTAPVIRTTYDATLATGDLIRVLHNPSLPSGIVRVTGSMRYQNHPNQPLLQTVWVEGKASSPALRIHTPQLTTNITDISTAYTLTNGNAMVRDLRAHVLGGELTGQMVVRDVTGNSRSHVQASLRGASLSELNPVLNQMASSPSMRPVALSGTVNLDTDAAWGRTIADLVATVDADVHAAVAPGTRPNVGHASLTAASSNAVPLNGTIHARYAAAQETITFANSSLNTPHTSITLNGMVSSRSSLQVRVVSQNLHELETLSDTFRKPAPGQPVQPLGLYGKASFDGSVTGTTSAPDIRGQLAASSLQVRGSSWKSVQTNVTLSPSLASLQNGSAEPAKQGRITFDVQVELQHWSFTPSSPIQVAINASRLSISDLLRVANSNAPVSGTLNANVSVHGTELNPVGQGTAGITHGMVSGEPLQSLNVHFQGTGEVVHANLNMSIPSGGGQANLTYYPKQRTYEATLQAANIHLGQLKSIAEKRLGISGLLTISASGRGSIDNPELQATATVPQLSIRNQNVSNLKVVAAVQNRIANVTLDSNAVNTTIRGRATVNLSGDYEINATLDTQRIPLQSLVAIYSHAHATDVNGQTELHATLSGPLKNPSQLRGQLEIPILSLNYQTIQLGAVAPIRANYTNGVATIEPAEIRGTGTDLQLRGSIPVKSQAKASVLLLGTVDLHLLQVFDSTVESSGQLRFNINSFADQSGMSAQGEINIVNASLAPAGAPIGLQKVNGTLTLRNDRLEISSFKGSLGGGDVTARGAILYRPSLQFDVALAAKGVRVAYPEGVRTGLDGDLALTGTADNSLLRGQVRITALYFTPDFDINSFVNQFNSASSPPATGGFAQNMHLNIAVQSTSQLNAVSRTVSLKGSASLTATGTADQPVILGHVDLTGGDLLFFGNRYVIQNGTIAFVNAVQTEPVLNVQASTTIDQYKIQLRFQGPFDRLRTSYTSDPSLPPTDIIHLLAFGQTTEAAAANSTPGNLGAESIIAQGVSSQVTSRLQKVAGISHISIDPTLGTTQANPGARVTVQQRVTSNLFVTFETDVTSTQHEVIQLQYQINPRWSVSTTRDQNGGFSFDASVRKTF